MIRARRAQLAFWPAATIAILGIVVLSVMTNPRAESNARNAAQLDSDVPLHLLDINIETSTGERTSLAATAGQVRIATMFYSHCLSVCPRVVQTLQQVERQLAPAHRSQLGVLLLTLDPESDSLVKLRAFELEQKIDKRWLVGRTSANDVQTLARELGIEHQKLGANAIDHGSALVLLDAKGRAVARTAQSSQLDPEFLAAVRAALARS